MSTSTNDETSKILGNQRLTFVGRLASMSKRDASQLARRHGAVVVDYPDPGVDLIVVGEEELLLGEGPDSDGPFDQETQAAVEQGQVEVLTETQLWHRIGLVEAERDIHRLYTPAMLADLLGVPVAVIRRWHRRGLIVPVREVRRLAYFDFQEVSTARRLAELLAAGMSPAAIEKKLEALARYLPEVKRPLAQLSVIIQGKEILLRQGDGLIEPGGQLRFDFEATAATTSDDESAQSIERADSIVTLPDRSPPAEKSAISPEELCRHATELEEEGRLDAAADMYRAALVAGGPQPEICFQLAELLYRQGDVSGARERYYMTIELDEDYVEARANLGCVLAETGNHDLAIAAFRGALTCHSDYADVHYHLARSLDEQERPDEAENHWRAFLDLSPNSPWADQARHRLTGSSE